MRDKFENALCLFGCLQKQGVSVFASFWTLPRKEKSGQLWDLLAGFVFLFLLIATCGNAIRNAFEIGADEHYEVMKALLWSRGFSLYDRIWDDQPPLFTILLGFLFRTFGPTIAVARVLAGFFGALLMMGVFHAVRKRSGLLTAVGAAGCLLMAPRVVDLSVSAMLEVPAFAVAIAALWPLHHWVEQRKAGWLAFSGLIIATALQIKLSAALIVPALFVEIVLIARKSQKALLRDLVLWATSVAAGYVILSLLLGAGLEQAWSSHFSGKAPTSLTNQYEPSLHAILQHTEGVLGFAACIIMALCKRDWQQIAFPLTLLATVCLVHSIHRPYWDYYYLHFSIPLAWLSGYATTELLRRAWKLFKTPAAFSASGVAILISAAIIEASVVAFGGIRLASEVGTIRSSNVKNGNAIISCEEKYAGRTTWFYTQATMFPFHANLCVIPELAVLPRKRLWSGQITRTQVLAIVRRYKPEQILLSAGESVDPEIKALGNAYTMVCEDSGYKLYVSKSLAEGGPGR